METGTWKFNGVAKHSFVSQMTKCKESPEKKTTKKTWMEVQTLMV